MIRLNYHIANYNYFRTELNSKEHKNIWLHIIRSKKTLIP